MASSFAGFSTTTEIPRRILAFWREKSRHAILASVIRRGIAAMREDINMFIISRRQPTGRDIEKGLTLRGDGAVESVSLDEHRFTSRLSVSLEDVDGLNR